MPRGERRGESVEVLDRDVQRGGPEDPHRRHAPPEVDAHATGMGAAEGEVAVADAPADADGGDPQPRSLDAPRRDVVDGRTHAADTESRIELLAQVDEGRLRSDSEEQPEEEP
jgi:hypothetical protein